jgi:Ni,Fe-hydrogenase I cytochrome b subunit
MLSSISLKVEGALSAAVLFITGMLIKSAYNRSKLWQPGCMFIELFVRHISAKVDGIIKKYVIPIKWFYVRSNKSERSNHNKQLLT